MWSNNVPRGLTVGTKVRINAPEVREGEVHGRVGKVITVSPGLAYPYHVEYTKCGQKLLCPFKREELTRINKKRTKEAIMTCGTETV